MGACLTLKPTTIHTDYTYEHTTQLQSSNDNVNKDTIYFIGRHAKYTSHCVEYLTEINSNILTKNKIKPYSFHHNYPIYNNGHDCQTHCADIGICYYFPVHRYIINNFKKSNINIEKICTSASSPATFWITKNGKKVYGNSKIQDAYSWNSLDYIPIASDYPNLVTYFNSTGPVVDIQSNQFCIIALCTGRTYEVVHKIVDFWTHFWSNSDEFSADILNLIFSFQNDNSVHKQQVSQVTGASLQWSEIKFFENRNIKKIALTEKVGFLLGFDGIVWKINLIFNEDWPINPQEVKYLSDNGLKVSDISCGKCHCLALIGKEKKVYSWLDNEYGQLGNGNTNNVSEPKCIESLSNIERIECGSWHSYCMSSDGKHWLFGNNAYNECINYDYECLILQTFLINDNVFGKRNGDIKLVSPGHDNTIVIVGSKS